MDFGGGLALVFALGDFGEDAALIAAEGVGALAVGVVADIGGGVGEAAPIGWAEGFLDSRVAAA